MMMKACKDVIESKTPVDKAADRHGVPRQTLRDRVLGRVKITSKWGKDNKL